MVAPNDHPGKQKQDERSDCLAQSCCARGRPPVGLVGDSRRRLSPRDRGAESRARPGLHFGGGAVLHLQTDGRHFGVSASQPDPRRVGARPPPVRPVARPPRPTLSGRGGLVVSAVSIVGLRFELRLPSTRSSNARTWQSHRRIQTPTRSLFPDGFFGSVAPPRTNSCTYGPARCPSMLTRRVASKRRS